MIEKKHIEKKASEALTFHGKDWVWLGKYQTLAWNERDSHKHKNIHVITKPVTDFITLIKLRELL